VREAPVCGQLKFCEVIGVTAYFRTNIYKKFARLLLLTLTGHAKMRTMILTCSILASVILAYVSTQIYASKVQERVTDLKKQQILLTEKINDMAAEYTLSSSRSKVVDYCEKKLGMVKAGDRSMIRVAVEEESSFPELAKSPGSEIWKETHLALGNINTRVSQ
jgi:cell division protein FtsL